MKKLLSTLTLAPLAITACGGGGASTPAPVEKTNVAYGYTHKGYITKATVKTKGNDITAVDYDETYSKVDATKTNWSEITADADVTKAEAALTSKIKYSSYTGASDKNVCLMNRKVFETRPENTFATTDAVLDAVGANGKTVIVVIEEGSSVIASVPMSAHVCTSILQYGGTWIAKGTSANIKSDHDWILSESYFNKTLAASASGVDALIDAHMMSAIVAADKYTTQATNNEINATKGSSLGIDGIEYGTTGTNTFDWDKSRKAIIEYFMTNGKGFKTSTISTDNLGNGTDQTAITGATASSTNDYAKTIQAAIKKAING